MILRRLTLTLRPPATAGAARGSRRGLCRAPGVRVLVVLLMLVSQFPSLAAGLIMIASSGGEHSVTCSFGARELKVVLGHPDERSQCHQHTLVEQAFLGRSSEDHRDHQFRFAREDAAMCADELTASHDLAPAIVTPGADLAALPWPRHGGRAFVACRPPPRPGAGSHPALLQGVVMRR